MEVIDPNKLVGLRATLFEYERKFEEALILVESDTANRYLRKGYYNYRLGNLEKAHSYSDSAKVKMVDRLSKDPMNFGRLVQLGVAYAILGQKEEAIEKGLEATKLLPISKDALVGANLLGGLAQIYVLVGEYDDAIDQLELLLSIPSNITVAKLKLDPIWDPLREHPRFIKLIAD